MEEKPAQVPITVTIDGLTWDVQSDSESDGERMDAIKELNENVRALLTQNEENYLDLSEINELLKTYAGKLDVLFAKLNRLDKLLKDKESI